jgi:hypothetical protein
MSNLSDFFGGSPLQWPTPSSSVTGHYGFGGGASNINYLPGFSDDASAGSTIKVSITAYYAANFEYYDGNGAQITSGSWAGGITAADFTGASNIMQAYMDATDEKMYVLVMKLSTTPDEVALAHVNKEGVVVMHPYRSFSTATLDGIHSWGALLRPGGDGVGDFKSIASAAGGVPRRGKIYTIAVADGAITEATWMGAGGLHTSDWQVSGSMGPTSNNIYGNIRQQHGTHVSAQNKNPVGSLVNATTGNYIPRCLYPNDDWGPGGLNHVSGITDKVFGWRGRYAFIGASGDATGREFKKDEIHTMIDKLAVQYGIL